MNYSDTDTCIRRLILAILELMPKFPGDWVPWPQVAKEIEGTVVNAFIWSGFARLPGYLYLFDNNDHVVKLSPAGIAYAQSLEPERLSEVQLIAAGVTKYAARLHPISINIIGIAHVARVGMKYVHAVSVDDIENNIPSETPVSFSTHGGGSTYGKLVGQEPDGGVLYILFDRKILETELPGSLKIDRGYLLSQLAEQIKKLPSLPLLVKPIFYKAEQNVNPIAALNSVKVADSLSNLTPPWSRLLWGPPGAGKTYALGHLIAKLLQNEPGGKILVVAPSNRAVDVAVEELIGQIKNTDLWKMVQQRKLLRFGYPRKSAIIECAEILGPVELDNLSREVEKLSKRILEAEQVGSSDSNLAVLRAQMLAAQEQVKTAVENHVQQCRVVATTVTLAYMPASPINTCLWDTVVVDEATMVTPALCTFLASLAQKRLLFAGDPRQLGPVYESGGGDTTEDYEWMGRDIFDKSGVSRGEGLARQVNITDGRLARVTSQRRCVPEIWSKVSRLYPEVENTTSSEGMVNLISLPPGPGRSVVLLDTAGNEECKSIHHSWQNQVNAELGMEVALTIASESANQISIAIISPYRAQVNLLKKWLRQEQRAERNPYDGFEIDAGTVHQFQGSGADVVIFDMVDGVGRPHIGKLLQGDTGIRLVNVAITRAKAKLIIIADKRWCNAAFIRSENPLLWDLIFGQETGKQLIVVPRVQLNPENQNARTESPIEQKLYEALLSIKELPRVNLQHVIRDNAGIPVSRADFAFPDIKYAVYCDGKQWHLTPNRWQRDWRQRNRLTQLGWIFSVFTGSEVYRNPDDCALQVLSTYRNRRQQMQKSH